MNATVQMENAIHKPHNALNVYVKAMEENDFEKAAQIIEKSIVDIDPNDTPLLISSTKHHIKLLFRLQKYSMVIEKCAILRSLHYDIDNDQELLLIETESEYKTAAKKALSRYTILSTKYKAEVAREHIEFNLNTIYEKENIAGARSYKRKRN